jgi:hypothetical protein
MKKIIAILFLVSLGLQAQTFETLVSKNNTFLSSLTETQRASMILDFKNDSRTKWTNLPVRIKPRKRVNIGAFSAESKMAHHQVLTAALSSQAYLKVRGIMSQDDTLTMIYKNRLDKGEISERQFQRMIDLDGERDNFLIYFYGTTDLNEPCGINIGGHHFGFHVTAANRHLSMMTLFLGTDPSEVLTTEFADLRVLSKEEGYSFLFINVLSDHQKAEDKQNIGIPRDIITSTDGLQMIKEYTGVKASELNSAYKKLLEVVIKEYIKDLTIGKAKEVFNKIEAACFDNVYFSCFGSYETHKNHCYVINGPTFLIEYYNAGLESKSNHIHSIYREKGNDFVEDIVHASLFQSQALKT